MSFCILPDEMLLIIFNYCDTYDLIRLNGVCKRFYYIISEFLNKESNHLLVTSQMSEKFRERCQPLLSSYESKFSIHYNWKHGRYAKKIFVPKFLSGKYSLNNFVFEENYGRRGRLQMTKDTIWLSQTIWHNLCVFNRTKNGSMSDDNWIAEKCNTEIYSSVLCNDDVIVTGHKGGSIIQWTIESLDEKKYFNKKLLRSSPSSSSYQNDVNFIDITRNIIIIGSYYGKIKMWKYIPQENAITKENIIFKLNLDWFSFWIGGIAFDPTGTKFAMIAVKESQSSYTDEIYKEIDMNYFEKLLWEDSNTILLLGSEHIKKMDLRTDKVVHTWDFPFDHQSTPDYDEQRFTCMSSDNLYAIMTGTACGQVILWDQRQRALIKTYEVPHDNYSGGVYSLQFDSSHMYVLTNKLNEFDFTI